MKEYLEFAEWEANRRKRNRAKDVVMGCVVLLAIGTAFWLLLLRADAMGLVMQ